MFTILFWAFKSEGSELTDNTLLFISGQNTKIFLQRDTYAEWIHMPSFHGNGNVTNCSAPPDYPLDKYAMETQVTYRMYFICTVSL